MSTSKTPIKLTPLHWTAQRLGATFTEQRGWRIPEVYTTPEDEITAAREGIVLADETPNGKLLLEGDHAESVLMEAFRFRFIPNQRRTRWHLPVAERSLFY